MENCLLQALEPITLAWMRPGSGSPGAELVPPSPQAQGWPHVLPPNLLLSPSLQPPGHRTQHVPQEPFILRQ